MRCKNGKYKNIEVDIINVKPFIKINLFGIFLFSKKVLFISANEIQDK